MKPPLRNYSLLLLISKYGGVAQLGERLNGIQEVIGSIPTVSTRKNHFFGSGFFNEINPCGFVKYAIAYEIADAMKYVAAYKGFILFHILS